MLVLHPSVIALRNSNFSAYAMARLIFNSALWVLCVSCFLCEFILRFLHCFVLYHVASSYSVVCCPNETSLFIPFEYCLPDDPLLCRVYYSQL